MSWFLENLIKVVRMSFVTVPQLPISELSTMSTPSRRPQRMEARGITPKRKDEEGTSSSRKTIVFSREREAEDVEMEQAHDVQCQALLMTPTSAKTTRAMPQAPRKPHAQGIKFDESPSCARRLDFADDA